MRSAAHILIAFCAKYPAFDGLHAPDFKGIFKIVSSPHFELLDLQHSGLNISDYDAIADEEVRTDSKLNSVLDFKNELPSNAVNVRTYCLAAESFYNALVEM